MIGVIVLSLEFLLKQAGFRARTVADGEAALAGIVQDPPDLLLLDVIIPRSRRLRRGLSVLCRNRATRQ
jgi:DNA-binding response OmpR family regulator